MDSYFGAIYRGEQEPDPYSNPCEGCGNCCTADLLIELTPAEIYRLMRAGTHMRTLREHDLDRIPTDYDPQPDKTLWIMTSDCGNFDPVQRDCMDYENRPDACREFEPGALSCQLIRHVNDLPFLPMDSLFSRYVSL